jgi:hypothetical protein
MYLFCVKALFLLSHEGAKHVTARALSFLWDEIRQIFEKEKRKRKDLSVFNWIEI